MPDARQTLGGVLPNSAEGRTNVSRVNVHKQIRRALILMLVVGRQGAAEARIWHIKPDGRGDAPTIQAGVDSAQVGDEIVLAPGTFTWASQAPTGETMVVMKPGITLRGEAGAEATVIDAEMQGRGIRCTDTGVVRIEGLTVTGGFFDRLHPIPEGYGSGILSTGNSQPTISRCILRENISLFGNLGAGIACLDMGATIENCQIFENAAGYGSEGAGVYVVGGRVSDCLIRDNRNVGDGANAAGMKAIGSTIENCWFASNRCLAVAGAAGGAMQARGGTIRGCTFVGNEVGAEFLGNAQGGAIWSTHDDVDISDCIFIQNRVTSVGYPGKGGAISAHSGGRPTVTNCTFLGNVATFLYPVGPGVPIGGLDLEDGGTVRSSIIAWSDGAPCEGPVTMTCTILYQNSLGDAICGTDGGGNAIADPLFCSQDPIGLRDVRISSASPAAPDQSGNCGLIGAGAVDCTIVPVQQRSWSEIKALYRD